MQRITWLLVLSPLFSYGATSTLVTGDKTITKVVKLLQEMLDKSKADGDKDTDMFAKYKCYCDINAADKTKAIADNTQAISLLSSEIGELQAENGKLSTECAELETRMTENERARSTADSLRGKAAEDFLSEESDMENAIGQMGQAIDTLAAIGSDQAALISHKKFMIKSSPKTALLTKMTAEVKGAVRAASIFLSPRERKMISSFLQAPFAGTYQSQGSEIVGILKNMRDTFKSNLASARAAESAASEAHQKFMKVKAADFDRSKVSFDDKDGVLGTNDNSLSTKRDQKSDAQTTMGSDQEFLGKLLNICGIKTTQYEDRKMVRANEESAIAQAQSILNGDASFDNPATGLVQLTMRTRHMSVRDQVRQSLAHVAKKRQSIKLARIAASLEAGNPFTKVVAEIQAMIDLIAREEKADDDEKAWCDSEREENVHQKSMKKKNIEHLNGKIDDIVDLLDSEVDGLRKQQKDEQETLAQCMKDQSEEIADRKESNVAYQKNVNNLVEAQTTLNKATKVLRKFYDWLKAKQGPHHYEKKSGKDSTGNNIKRIPESTMDKLEEACSADPACVGFNSDGWLKSKIVADGDLFDASGDLYEKVYDSDLLQARREDPAPPASFDDAESGDGTTKGQSDKGGDVMGMLEFILSEAAEEEKTAHSEEEEAQRDFEDEMNDLKSQEKTSQETIASLEASIAAKVKELEQARVDRKKTSEEKVAIEKYLSKIKPGCDFITEFIGERKDNREAETSALNTAIEKLEDTPAYKEAQAKAEAGN